MRAEVIAVGTELLIGQLLDTNSQWLGEQLTLQGLDINFHTTVGDNVGKISNAMRAALARSDFVIVCGGLGPTHDDLTRDAIAAVKNVRLVPDNEIEKLIGDLFAFRGLEMPPANLSQALVPEGCEAILMTRGTAPGLICPVGLKYLFALPGVPHEMKEMALRAVFPKISEVLDERGERAVIESFTIKTWGLSESKVAEMLSGVIAELEANHEATIALLASAVEGIRVRITAKSASSAEVQSVLGKYRQKVEEILGDSVFGFNSDTIESVVGRILAERSLTLGLAESLTGGMVSSRITSVPGASEYFKGCVVSYATEVKRSVIGVTAPLVVSELAASEMAHGVRERLGCDIGLSLTGVAGPESQEGVAPGVVHLAISGPGSSKASRELKLPGDRDRVRELAATSALDLLRKHLLQGA